MRRLKKLSLASLLLFLLVSVFSVAFPISSAEAASTSRVRVAHLSPDTPNVDVYVNGGKTLSNVPFKAVSDYLTVPSGAYRFEVRVAGSPATSPAALDIRARLAPHKDYTVAAINFLAKLQGKVYVDDNSAPVVGYAKVRVLHASPDAPAVDIAVNNEILFGHVEFSNLTETLAVPVGTYDGELRVAGTNIVALALKGVTLESGKVYTFIAADAVAKLSAITTTVPGVLKPNATSRVRVAHLSPDTPNVDVYVNNLKVLSNVPFKAVSDLLTVPSGQYNFKVRVAGSPANSTPAIDTDAYLQPGQTYTVGAIDFLAHVRAQIWKEPRTVAPGKAALQVIHASPDAPAVDVAVKGGPVLVRNLSFGEDSRDLALNPGTYDLEVRVAGTNTVVLPLPGVKIEAGKVYTVFAVDTVSKLSVVATAISPL
jgi:Domain of unknown function (DUF4397)